MEHNPIKFRPVYPPDGQFMLFEAGKDGEGTVYVRFKRKETFVTMRFEELLAAIYDCRGS